MCARDEYLTARRSCGFVADYGSATQEERKIGGTDGRGNSYERCIKKWFNDAGGKENCSMERDAGEKENRSIEQNRPCLMLTTSQLVVRFLEI